MKTIHEQDIINAVSSLCINACTYLDKSVLSCLKKAKENESGLAKNIIAQIIENDELAASENIPMCQDTGIAVFFVELGNQVFLDCDLQEAINKGVAKGYTEGYLRKSVVANPLNRINTKNNTPAIVHIKQTISDKLKITFCPKGAGSENMSQVRMLTPAQGIIGIKDFVLQVVKDAGGRACPPLVVGVGIGGDMEVCAKLAKEALIRDIDDQADDPEARKLEEELLELINSTDVGPMGLGGKTTALAVKVNLYACHIASLPVAVNLQCHACRHKEVTL